MSSASQSKLHKQNYTTTSPRTIHNTKRHLPVLTFFFGDTLVRFPGVTASKLPRVLFLFLTTRNSACSVSLFCAFTSEQQISLTGKFTVLSSFHRKTPKQFRILRHFSQRRSSYNLFSCAHWTHLGVSASSSLSSSSSSSASSSSSSSSSSTNSSATCFLGRPRFRGARGVSSASSA